MITKIAPWDRQSETILAIQNLLGDRLTLPQKAHQEAILKAHLYKAATVAQDQEAREQLRILSAITADAQDAYFSA